MYNYKRSTMAQKKRKKKWEVMTTVIIKVAFIFSA
jgi:hypothetical protein